MAKGRKVHADEAVELLVQWEQSGEPMSKWCATRGLNWYSLSAYKGWLGARWDTEPEVAFAEVVIEPVETRATVSLCSRYRIQAGAVIVEVDDHFQEATLRRLLGVVASC